MGMYGLSGYFLECGLSHAGFLYGKVCLVFFENIIIQLVKPTGKFMQLWNVEDIRIGTYNLRIMKHNFFSLLKAYLISKYLF